MILEKYASMFIDQDKTFDSQANDKMLFQPEILKSGLVYIVTETVFHYPYPWISEKTIKGFLSKRPMIIVGAPYTLKTLKELGFSTFDSLWSEKYDQMESPSDRMAEIIDLIKSIAALPQEKLYQLALKSQSIVEFNFDHYQRRFVDDAVCKIYVKSII